MAWLAVFAAATIGLLAAHQIYRITGPHPAVTAFGAQPQTLCALADFGTGLAHSQLVPLPVPHYANASDASGHDAQRAKT